MKLFIIIFWIVIGILTFVIYRSERFDITPNGDRDIPRKLNGSEYHSTNNVDQIIDNIKFLGKEQLIFWKRAILISFAIALIAGFLICKTIPSPHIFIAISIPSILCIYYSMHFYDFHHTNIKSRLINQNIDALKLHLKV